MPNLPIKSSQSKASKPEVIYKGQRELEHHLFRLKIAKLKKNTSYKLLRPSLHDVEHTHFWHSISEKGTTNVYCAPVAGHFHKVEVDFDKWNTDKTGPLVTVGPPLHFKRFRLKGGNKRMVKRIVPIAFESENSSNAEITIIEDKHTHEAEYLETERISMVVREKKKAEERSKVEGIMDRNHVSTQAAKMLHQEAAKAPTPMEETDKSDT